MHWEIPSGYLISGERIIVEPEELELVRIGRLSKTTCLLVLSRMEREGVTEESLSKTPLLSLQEREICDLSFCRKKINDYPLLFPRMWRSNRRSDRLYVAVCCCQARDRQTSRWPTFVATDHLCDPLLFCVTWPHVRFYLVHFDTKFELSSLYQKSKYLFNKWICHYVIYSLDYNFFILIFAAKY